LPGSDAAQALLASDRIRVAFAEEAKAAIDPVKAWGFAFGVSIGISELKSGETLENAIRRADEALYKAKDAGRNRCELALEGE
jgi:diguanylate cyclase (GGDEF)-like protein